MRDKKRLYGLATRSAGVLSLLVWALALSGCPEAEDGNSDGNNQEEMTEGNCADRVDDDGDGDTDCDDSDCAGDAACNNTPDPEVCGDGRDNDGDGDIDCDDSDCASDADCNAPDPEICDDGADNDGDGDADCDDDDCADAPNCAEQPDECVEACGRLSDECAPDFLALGCPEAVVSQLTGQCELACADPEIRPQLLAVADLACETLAPLAVDGFGLAEVCGMPDAEVCDDELDNDGDGDVDCADSDCADDPACEVVDPCADVVCDAPPANDCEEQVAVTYPSAGACLDGVCGYEATRTDCGANGQLCQEGACVDPPDPCADVICNTPPAAACDGDVAVTYGVTGACAEGECSYEATRADCAANGQLCEAGACVDPPDPCEGVVCNTPPAAMCDGQVAVTYGVTGACAEGECSYEATRADCAANGQLCEAGACVDPPDPCEGVVCNTPPAATCDGDVAITYAVSGVCAEGECSYEATLVDCAATEQLCEAGACVGLPVEICDDEQDNDGDEAVDCDDEDCFEDPACAPIPGTCDLPNAILAEGVYFGSNEGAQEQLMGSCGGTGAEQVWALGFESEGPVTFCISTENSTYDTVLYVRQDICEATEEIGCSDDIGEGVFQSRLEVTLAPFTQYFVVVDAFDVEEIGSYELSVQAGPCELPPVEICDNGGDDDGDEAIDCQDPDCFEDPFCFIPTEICDNEIDDDGDLSADCADSDCIEAPNCFIPFEICGDEQDNDGDEAVDCEDPDCFFDPFCFVVPEICDNEVDDDGNGLTDCEDLACGQDPACANNEPNGTCAAPFIFDNIGAFTGNSSDAVNEHQGACQTNDGNEEVWSFGVTRTTTVCVDTIGSSYDTVLYVRSGDCVEGTQVACNDDAPNQNFRSQVEFVAEPETNYFVFADSFGTNSGAYTINLRLGPCGVQPVPEVCGDEQDNDQNGLFDCEDPVCATLPECRIGGGLCEDPYGVTAFGTFEGNSVESPNNHIGSCGGNGREDVWAFSVTQPLTVCVDTFGSAFDTTLYARANDCFQGQQLACNDDAQGTTSQIELNVVPDTNYFIYVDAFFANGGGAYNLNIFPGPCATRLEVCDDNFDNDNNGLTDCAEESCAEHPACLPEFETGLCNDQADNDGDGDIDCFDEDCFEDPVCQIEATSIAPQSGSIFLEGSLDNTDPTWARPGAGCAAGSGTKYYDAFPITNNTGSPQRLDITAAWLGDGYLHVYRAPFDPNNLDGCVIGDDDFANNGQPAANGSQIIDQLIQPGEILYVVASTFSNNAAIGAYAIEVYTQPVAIAAPGEGIMLTGSIDNTDPLWARPNANCTAGSGTKYYETFAILNETGVAQTLTLNAYWAGDGFLHVFRPEFDAANPTVNCVIGDDDFAFPPNLASRGSQILNQTIQPGEILILVASTFSNNVAIGPYSLEIITNAPLQ